MDTHDWKDSWLCKVDKTVKCPSTKCSSNQAVVQDLDTSNKNTLFNNSTLLNDGKITYNPDGTISFDAVPVYDRLYFLDISLVLV